MRCPPGSTCTVSGDHASRLQLLRDGTPPCKEKQVAGRKRDAPGCTFAFMTQNNIGLLQGLALQYHSKHKGKGCAGTEAAARKLALAELLVAGMCRVCIAKVLGLSRSTITKGTWDDLESNLDATNNNYKSAGAHLGARCRWRVVPGAALTPCLRARLRPGHMPAPASAPPVLQAPLVLAEGSTYTTTPRMGFTVGRLPTPSLRRCHRCPPLLPPPSRADAPPCRPDQGPRRRVRAHVHQAVPSKMALHCVSADANGVKAMRRKFCATHREEDISLRSFQRIIADHVLLAGWTCVCTPLMILLRLGS